MDLSCTEMRTFAWHYWRQNDR